MKKVFIVCGKDSEKSYNFWIIKVCSTKELAEKWVLDMDIHNPNYYHYYFEEPIEEEKPVI